MATNAQKDAAVRQRIRMAPLKLRNKLDSQIAEYDKFIFALLVQIIKKGALPRARLLKLQKLALRFVNKNASPRHDLPSLIPDLTKVKAELADLPERAKLAAFHDKKKRALANTIAALKEIP